jgi:DNA-binding CsgD family transcriptional regulator
MLCNDCGCANLEAAAFCARCGAALTRSTVQGDRFIGRYAELAVLDAAVERVLAGYGQVMLLGGDPGIGKTRTAQEFAARAESRGMRVLWGRCYEEAGAPLYWPWLQLLRGWLEDADDAQLAELMNEDCGLIAELLPELRPRLHESVAPPSAADPDQARFRLFDAITRFWQRVARRRPLVLILDDLHWADTASLKLLEFLARDMTTSPVLLLGGFRDLDLNRRHPLSDTLAALSRLGQCQRLALRGMTHDDTEALVGTLAGTVSGTALMAAVCQHSEGNPLFIRELTRYLLHEALSADGVIPHTPAGIREVIGQRLNRLSGDCNRVLGMAAVIGRRFDLDVLTGLDETLSQGELLDALEEALGAHIVEELPQAGRYQFSHALIRETLYEELSAVRRLRLHQKVGERVEAVHRHDLQAHLPQLAHHFSQAAPAGAAATAIDYAERAGARADALLAYEEAGYFYRLSLQLLAHYFSQDGERRCRLLLAEADALNRAGGSGAAQDLYLQAADLARSLGLVETFARISLGFENAGWRIGHSGSAAVALLEEALALLQPGDERLRARLLAALCRANCYRNQAQEAREAFRAAVKLARRLGDSAILFEALSAFAVARHWPEYLEERLAAGREALDLGQRAGHPEWAVGKLSGWYFGDLMEYGDIEAARRVLDLHMRVADAVREPFLQAVGLNARTQLTLHEGRFADAEREARENLVVGRRFSAGVAEGVFGVQMFTLHRELGKLPELLPMLKYFVGTTPRSATWRQGLALLYAELDMADDARAEFEYLVADDMRAVPRDAMWLTNVTYLADVCVYLQDTERAELLYGYLLPYVGRNIVSGAHTVCFGSADRFLGMLAVIRQQWDSADRHFGAAIAMDQRTGGRPWLAHDQYQYAQFWMQRKQPERAIPLLEAALATARELGMVTLERRCTTLKEALADRPVFPDGLSRREVQVLQLLAAGRSNREIAAQLFVSPNTVANHVRSILTKTRTANRTEAAGYAIRHGLVTRTV